MIAALIAGLGLGLFLSVSVGPVIFAIIKHSVNNGFRAGLSFALGVSFSDTMFVLLGNFATAFILELSEFKKAIGISGGILLVVMGIYGLFFKKVKISTGEEKPELFRKRDFARIWLSGFMMNTLNPAVILFWLGTTAAINGTTKEASHKIVLYGVCLGFVLGSDILKVFMSNKIRHKLTLQTVIWLNRVAGLSMLLFGCALLYRVFFDVSNMTAH